MGAFHEGCAAGGADKGVPAQLEQVCGERGRGLLPLHGFISERLAGVLSMNQVSLQVQRRSFIRGLGRAKAAAAK